MLVGLQKKVKYALDGLRILYKSEKSFRFHFFVALLVILFGIWKGLDRQQWLIVLLIIAVVISLEIVNSAIERLVDLVAPKTHGLAKEIKDILAGMILLMSFFAVIIGLMIFFW